MSPKGPIAGTCSVVLLMGAAGCNREARVCYPGPNDADDQCVILVEAEDIATSGYDYPPPYQDSVQYSAPTRYLDLEFEDPLLQVAPNFQLVELAQVEKGRYGVVQPHAVRRLQAMRDQIGGIGVNSGYRSPGHNATIPGSATSSRHQYGDAFDLDPTSGDLDAMEAACVAQNADYIGVYETHRHCDWRFTTLDVAFYGAELTGTEERPPLDIASVRVRLPDTDAYIEPIEVGGVEVLTAPATGWDEGEPLREWTAYDGGGHTLEEATGRTYVPPADAFEVEVDVGREVLLSYRL